MRLHLISHRGDSFSGSNCHPLALLAGQSCVGVVNQIKDLDNTASRGSLDFSFFHGKDFSVGKAGKKFLITAGEENLAFADGI